MYRNRYRFSLQPLGFIGIVVAGVMPCHAGFVASGSWDASWNLVTLTEVPMAVDGEDSGSLDLSGGSAEATLSSSPYRDSKITAEMSGVESGAGGSVPRFRSKHRIDLNGVLKPDSELKARRLKISSEITGDFTDTVNLAGYEQRDGFVVLNLRITGSVTNGRERLESADFNYNIQGSTKGTAFINGTQPVGTFEDQRFEPEIAGQATQYGTPGEENYTGSDSNPLSSLINPSGYGIFTPAQYSQVRLPVAQGQTEVVMSLNVIDKLSMEVTAYGAGQNWEWLEIFAERNYSNTIQIQMGFQDAQGNWLDDVTATSASGYTYDPVPEPAGLAVLALGGLMLSGRRRC